MPFKSQAQRRKLHAMARRGEIPQAVVDEFERKTGSKKLPKRVKRKKR